MRGEVILGYTFVSFQSSAENGCKVMRGGCGGPGADSGSGDASADPGWCKKRGGCGGGWLAEGELGADIPVGDSFSLGS